MRHGGISHRHHIGLGWFAFVSVLGCFSLWLDPIDLRRPVAITEIFRGVWYSCDEISGEDGRGLVHIVRVDLTAPGVRLFVTPLDSDAITKHSQYRLAFAPSVLREHGLAAVINGTLYAAAGPLPFPGALASSNETLVAVGQVSHVHEHSYLLWFDEHLTPKLELSKPPSPQALARARWGISGQGVALHGGTTSPHGTREADRRTALGVNPATGTLWLAVFEHATGRGVAHALAAAGATEAVIVDGGDSTTMAIGPSEAGVDPGILLGGRRPVATFFGVRAEVLDETGD